MKKPYAIPKKDPFTGEEFIPKRSNQKFATLANKTAFNNAKAKQRVNEKKPILNILSRNEIILAWVLGTNQEITVTKEYLLGAGFRFDYFTGTILHNRRMYNRVYNFGFFACEKNYFIVTKIF